MTETLKNLNINNEELLELEDGQWNKIFNFDSDKNLEKIKNVFNEVIKQSRNKDLIKKYIETKQHRKIPIWSLSIFLSFGDLLYLFQKLNNLIQIKILNEFDKELNVPSIFVKIIEVLKNLRNRCCHNNVVYSFKLFKK